CDCPLRLRKLQLELCSPRTGQPAGSICLPVTGFGRILTKCRRIAGHPACVGRGQLRRLQPRMVMPLHDIQRVAGQVFTCGVPGVARAVLALPALYTAYTQTFALPERMEGQPLMLPQHFTIRCLDGPGLGRQVAVQEFPEGALTN